ncbi:Putative extracellular enzyme of alpha/beta hydrolase superfamily [Sandaracinus amylolyticus]|nr:Putative extracellular enzyme of alpha/beta hydrolase superfamily [Sandaracinus amylolyticus]
MNALAFGGRAALLAMGALAVACGPVSVDDADASIPASDAGPPDAGPPRAIFEVPRTGDEPLFDLPWPSDLRRTSEGTIDVQAFPNPRSNRLVRRYVEATTARLRGFGTNGAIYFRFSRDIDPASLPASPEASVRDDASVFVVDLDPESDTYLERHPMVVVANDAATLFWPASTIAMRPVHGLPLAGGRRYAAVVTRRVRAQGGETLARDADLEALIAGGGDASIETARAMYQPALDALAEGGIATDDVLSIAVFTTHDPVAELALFRDWMHAEYPAPTPRDATWMRTDRASYTELTGTYGPVPIFQEGELPYASEGGAMEPGADGEPVVHGEYDARFALTVPLGEMPENGYPLVLYAHGTGGDYRSFIDDSTGPRLAASGIAAMGIDQIHHGDRDPTRGSPELLFFNIQNPDAARDNNRQSALDIVQQARLVPALVVPMRIADRGGREIRFDPERVFFFGHSQGGLVGPVYLGIDDGVSAAVISAGSAVLAYALLEKEEPLSIPDVVRVALQLPGSSVEDAFESEHFGFEHPVITLVQSWIDASDGSNFGHLAFASPRPGFAPKSVLSTEGLMDEFSPPGAIEALATAMRVPQVEPIARSIPAHELLGIAPVSGAVTANVAGGQATAGLLQYPSQGHFAVFRDTSAQARIRGFLESAAAGVPVIPAP